MADKNDLEIGYVHIDDKVDIGNTDNDIDNIQHSLQSTTSSYWNFAIGNRTENACYMLCLLAPMVFILLIILLIFLAICIILLPYAAPITAMTIVYKIHKNTTWNNVSYCMLWTFVLMIIAAIYVGGFYMCDYDENHGSEGPFSICLVWKWVVFWIVYIWDYI